MSELATTAPDELNIVTPSNSALILDAVSMASIMELATMMAKGRSTVPEHLRGNASDCAAVIMQAMAWQMNPWAVGQKTHLVNGVLGYEAQLVNAVIVSSGATLGRFHYDWFGPWDKIIGKTKVIKMPAKDGKQAYEFRVPDYSLADEDNLGVRVWATLKGEVEPTALELLLVQAAVRNSPLWASDPKQQLAYLAVKRWARLYAPDVVLGVYTPDELEQTAPARRTTRQMGPADVVAPEVPAALLEQANAAAAAGAVTYEQFWTSTGKEHRSLLGGARHEEWKAIAREADARRTVEQAGTPA